MEDIVKRLRTQVTNRSKVAYDAADEIESLRAQLATANAEVARLNEWADGFTDTHLRERKTGDELIKELRAQLAEVTALKDRMLQTVATHAEEVGGYYSQLIATQAHAARLVEALEHLSATGEECEFNDMAGMCFQLDEWNYFEAALYNPINFDALHEALARECERLANVYSQMTNTNWITKEAAAMVAVVEAAAHRAKKDSHQ